MAGLGNATDRTVKESGERMAVGEKKAQKRRGMAQEGRRKTQRRGIYEKEERKEIIVGVVHKLIKFNFIQVYIYFEY